MQNKAIIAAIGFALVILCYVLSGQLLPLSSTLHISLATFHNNISSSSKDCEADDVACVASQARGIYHDARSQKQGLDNAILVVASNWAFSELLFNWICRAELFNLKFLVVAIDRLVYDEMKRLGYPVLFNQNGTLSSRDNPKLNFSGNSAFRAREFNLITCHKLEVVGLLMALGLDVLFSDVDIAFIRDPFPFLVRDTHFEFQGNNRFNLPFKCEEREAGNSGFYYIKAMPPAISTFSRALSSCYEHPDLDDQTLLFNVIYAHMTNETCLVADAPRRTEPLGEQFVFRALNQAAFMVGNDGPRYVFSNNPVILHANFFDGNARSEQKKELFQRQKLWLLRPRSQPNRIECSEALR